MTAAPDASAILRTAFAFWSSKVLLTAVRLDVFTTLGERARTAEELREELGLHEHGALDFLDALVSMQFLERDGDGPDARYRNTRDGATFLVRSSPRYIGGILEMLDARLYGFWHHLPEALRTGRPQNETRDGGASFFETLYADPSRLEGFLDAMTGLSRVNFERFAERFDLSRYASLCDVGGATGLLCIEVARRHPHVACTSFDLPVVEPIARRTIAAASLSDRVRTASGDFFADPLPRADVVTMGMILHDWNLERKRHLIRAAHDALPEGGALVTIEALIDDARRENTFGLLMSLNMRIEFGDAFDYSAKDFEGWCRAAGFRRFERLPLEGPHAAAIAYK